MKKFSYFSALFIISFFFSTSFGRQILKTCINEPAENRNSDNSLSISSWKGQIGGLILPSTGKVNVLVIFSQFPDDNFDTNNTQWPKGKAPFDKNNWINKNWTSNPTQGSLTHYFNDMSFNKFKFIGKTVSVIAPHTRQWYLDNHWQRGDIQKEIILQVNKTMDFAEFDNWNWIDYYKQVNEPDNRIDLIIIIWRNIAKELTNEEEIKQKLDFKDDVRNLGGFLSPAQTIDYAFPVDNGLRQVCMKYAGITVRNYLPDRNKAFRITVHEIAHYLLGDISYHNGFGFWGMLSSYGIKSIVANSFERSRLGWIKLKIIHSNPAQTIQDAKLSDYVTTGDAYCFEIDSASGQYFYLENHQNLSYWETVFKFGNIEKGLYVIRKDNLTPSTPDDNPSSAYMKLVPADGRFDWTVDQTVLNPWGPDPGDLPVFKKLKPDRINGYHDLDFIPWTWDGIKQKPSAIYFTEEQNGKAQMDVRYSGDSNDAFRNGYNEVLSPWSNPNSYKTDRTSTPFGFRIDSLVNEVYTIDIYVNNSIDAPPSKPVGLTIVGDPISHAAKLVWQSNIEPDLSSYEILREIVNKGNKWEAIGSTKETSFIDNSVYYTSYRGAVKYKIRAIDKQNLYSVCSDVKTMNIEPYRKITEVNEINSIKDYELNQNYPNPFNPSTKIKYSIPKQSHVTLKVYDILGREVAALVNEEKPAGNYELNWNAGDLPSEVSAKDGLASGVYFYQLKAIPSSGSGQAFIETKKMILMK